MRRLSDEVFEPLGVDRLPPRWPASWSDEEVILALEPLVLEERRAKLRQVAARRLGGVTVLLDRPHDPHNGAAVLRSAEAFGLQAVHVIPSAEAFLVAGSVSRGTDTWLDVHRHATPEHAIARLREQDLELVATHPEGELLPEELRQLPRCALLLGNEHRGLSEPLRRAATRSVRIPMRGFVESLNVSVASAILLAAATQGREGDLSLDAQRRLYARGLFSTVRRAPEVLAALDVSRGR